MDEELAAKLLAVMKPLIGRDERPEVVWDTPAHQEEHRRLSEHLSWLHAHKPKEEIVVPATYGRLMGRTVWNAAQERINPTFETDVWESDAGRLVALCLPSWDWLEPVDQAVQRKGLTRHPSRPVDGEGHIPHIFAGDPATIDVPLIKELAGGNYGRDFLVSDGSCDALIAGARRMLADWYRSEVIFWKNPETGAFRATYSKGPGSIPFEWLRRVVKNERKGPQERWRETMRQWERDVAVTQDGIDSLVRAHRRFVPPEQKELQQLRRDLDQVLPALLEEPITLGQSKVTSKDVAQALQHLPRRQAYVRIGTTAHAMETLPLGEPVDADEKRRRFRQLQEQTRSELCRHVSELGGGPDEPGAAGGWPKVDPRPPTTPQPATEAGPDSPSPGKPRLRRSRPLP